MKTIYRTQANRISIAEAKHLILEHLPRERYGALYARITPEGEIDWDGPSNVIEEVGVMAEPFINRDFPVMLAQMQVEPTMRFRPSIKGYPKTKTMDAEYTIAHDEFCRVVEGYQLLVVIGEAPKPQAALEQQAATPAPSSKRAKKRRTWRDVAMPYIVETYRSGKYKTAHTFYVALVNKAGMGNSPFTCNGRELFLTDIGQSVAEKTIANVMPEIKAAARKPQI